MSSFAASMPREAWHKIFCKIAFQISKLITNIVIAASAGFAAYQYKISRHDFHVSQALIYEQRFAGDRLSNMQEKLARIGVYAINKSVAQTTSQTFLTAAERDRVKTKLMLEYELEPDGRASADIPESLIEIVGFFDSLQICIEQKLCDSITAHAYFDNYAKRLWKVFFPVINFERSSQRHCFALSLQRFIGESPPKCEL